MKQNTKIKQLYLIGGVTAVLLILLDQLTKALAVSHLKGSPAFVIVKGVFELRYLENHGAAFGILQGKQIFFLVITLILALALVYIYGKIPLEKRFYPMHSICVVLFAGAIGNFIDRTLHNYVVDFFYFSLIDFPIFNVADIYVTCAVALFVILILFYYKESDLDRMSFWKKGAVQNKDE